MAYEYEVDVSVRVGVHVSFSSETELTDGDRDAFATSVAGDAASLDRLFEAHPMGVDSSADYAFEEYEGRVTLEDLAAEVLAIEAV